MGEAWGTHTRNSASPVQSLFNSFQCVHDSLCAGMRQFAPYITIILHSDSTADLCDGMRHECADEMRREGADTQPKPQSHRQQDGAALQPGSVDCKA